MPIFHRLTPLFIIRSAPGLFTTVAVAAVVAAVFVR
jgi:hypothetical protein